MSNSTQFIRITPNDDERIFERFIRAIRHCNNLSDARRFRSEIVAQLKKDSKSSEARETWGVYLKRLETGKRLVDQRIAQISAGTALHGSYMHSEAKVSTASRPEPATLEQVLRDTAGLSYFMACIKCAINNKC